MRDSAYRVGCCSAMAAVVWLGRATEMRPTMRKLSQAARARQASVRAGPVARVSHSEICFRRDEEAYIMKMREVVFGC